MASSSSSPPPPPTATPLPPLSNLIADKFAPFDHHNLVVRPFEAEAARDAAFEQELSTMLLDLLLETHAWCAARPKHESQAAVQRFEGKISAVLDVEKEQGTFASPVTASPPPSCLTILTGWYSRLIERTRERLAQFIVQMKSALAALSGLGL